MSIDQTPNERLFVNKTRELFLDIFTSDTLVARDLFTKQINNPCRAPQLDFSFPRSQGFPTASSTPLATPETLSPTPCARHNPTPTPTNPISSPNFPPTPQRTPPPRPATTLGLDQICGSHSSKQCAPGGGCGLAFVRAPFEMIGEADFGNDVNSTYLFRRRPKRSLPPVSSFSSSFVAPFFREVSPLPRSKGLVQGGIILTVMFIE